MQKKQIIIAVLGLTPQVVTETLYVLSQKREHPIVPHAVYIITTKEGKRKAIQELLSEGNGQFFRFCSEYGLDSDRIAFDESTIYVVRDAENRQLEDIRTTADNEAMANYIVNFVRDKAENSDTIIHASVAGGRKTMSVYMGYALTLFGREDDRLYHILVSPPELENHPEFYYLPKEHKTLYSPDGKAINTKNAVLELAEIPFVRIRKKLEQLDFEQKMSYLEMVKQSQSEIDLLFPVPEIKVDDTNCRIYINDTELVLSPANLAVYRTFIEQKTGYCIRQELPSCSACTDCFQDIYSMLDKSYLDRIFLFYSNVSQLDDEQIAKSRESSGYQTWHREKFAKINREIRNQFKDHQIERYCTIIPDRRTQGKRYGILIDKNKINIR